MPNTNAPFGAVAVGPILCANVYPKATNAAIYPGDFVKLTAAGTAAVATAGDVELLGVALGYAAASAAEVLVADDPDQQYYVQDSGSGGTLTASAVGNNVDLVATAGNATYLRSRHAASSVATSATAQLRILDKHPADEWGKYVRLRVMINEHTLRKTAGV